MEQNDTQICDKMIALFEEYKESFGLPSPEDREKTCDFEDAFNALICERKGHDIGPDQCNKPEHDYCYRCGKLRTALGISDWRHR